MILLLSKKQNHLPAKIQGASFTDVLEDERATVLQRFALSHDRRGIFCFGGSEI
jgi:hypothetical protein